MNQQAAPILGFVDGQKSRIILEVHPDDCKPYGEDKVIFSPVRLGLRDIYSAGSVVKQNPDIPGVRQSFILPRAEVEKYKLPGHSSVLEVWSYPPKDYTPIQADLTEGGKFQTHRIYEQCQVTRMFPC